MSCQIFGCDWAEVAGHKGIEGRRASRRRSRFRTEHYRSQFTSQPTLQRRLRNDTQPQCGSDYCGDIHGVEVADGLVASFELIPI